MTPRNQYEKDLVEIWEKTLGVHPIGMKDNFFELGGDSFAAVDLFLRINDKFDYDLPTITIIQAPTVAEIAKILESKNSTSEWRSLVGIQVMGSKPPFFCVHGYGGHILKFSSLAKYLGKDQPFYGLRAVGQDGKKPLDSIEKIANHYVQEILTIEKTGPYYLGGYSFGCLIAFEMAIQLHKMERQVGVMIMIDPNRRILSPQPQRVLKKMRKTLIKKNGFVVGNLKNINRKFRNWVKQRQITIALQTDRPIPKPLRTFAISHANVGAGLQYKPGTYSGRIVFYQTHRNIQIPHLLWQKYTGEGIEVHEIPGKHRETLDEPFVQALAEKLQQSLHMGQEGQNRSKA